MNRRTLKKLCQRARDELVARHGYRPDFFAPATGEESINAPPRMEQRFVRSGWLDPGPLRGTPLIWSDDGDASLPNEILAEVEYWANLSDAELARMASEPEAVPQSKIIGG